jgi:biopolymer transport protein ExbB
MEVIKFFQAGGAFMYPILVVLALGIAIAIERFLYITNTMRKTNRVWEQLVPMLKANDHARAIKMTQELKTPLAHMSGFHQAS